MVNELRREKMLGFFLGLGKTVREKMFANKFEKSRVGHHVGLFGTETLVDALTVFMSPRKKHGSLEDRDTCGCLSIFHVVLGTTWLS